MSSEDIKEVDDISLELYNRYNEIVQDIFDRAHKRCNSHIKGYEKKDITIDDIKRWIYLKINNELNSATWVLELPDRYFPVTVLSKSLECANQLDSDGKCVGILYVINARAAAVGGGDKYYQHNFTFNLNDDEIRYFSTNKNSNAIYWSTEIDIDNLNFSPDTIYTYVSKVIDECLYDVTTSDTAYTVESLYTKLYTSVVGHGCKYSEYRYHLISPITSVSFMKGDTDSAQIKFGNIYIYASNIYAFNINIQASDVNDTTVVTIVFYIGTRRKIWTVELPRQ